MNLDGRTALVTGAGRRLGKAIALALADAGADVIVHVGASVDEGRDVVERIRARGRRAELLAWDLADGGALDGFVDAAVEVLELPDLLVLAAANFHRATLAETGADLWNEIFDLNLRAQVLQAERFGRRMRARGGAIVIIGDAAASAPWSAYAAHAIAKGALHKALPILATGLAPEVRVNIVDPGPVLMPEHYDERQREQAVARTALQRAGSPDDVCRAVLFLLAEATYTTGAILPVDGGRHLYGPSGPDRAPRAT